jgi:pimeloyl-ACP methyl ester carboxylesterase/DNA-binding winged helix-turn-helix (wHTH) protein
VRFVFDGCELDSDTFEIRRDGTSVPVEPQVFDVLLHLVRHRDRVITKEELLDEVWGDRFVSESTLTSRVKAARRALGDDGRSQRFIRTVHGRGYRFVAAVEVVVDEAAGAGGPGDGDRPAPAPIVAPSSTIGAEAPIRYTRSDDLNIAYQVTGEGDVDLVLVAGFVSHLMLDWTEPRHAHFLERLGRFSRLIRFDKRGTGMSDRPGDLPDLETRMGDVAAVMGAARSSRAVLFGYSEGGPMSILYAATYPERVAGLVLYSSYARRLWAPDYPWGARPEERARYAEQIERDWAWETDMRTMCPNADDDLARWWGERCRAATSPGAARALVEMNSLVDVTDVLAAVKAPTLVLHRRDDVDSKVDEGRFLAAGIPGAVFVELDGADHFVAVDPDQILDPVEDFVRGLRPSAPAATSLTTILAVDARSAGELAEVRELLMPLLAEFGGTAATSAGSSVLATFDGPGRAVRCAVALVASAASRHVTVAAGLHTAEVERRGVDVAGSGIVDVSAVAARATAGEVWVTSTLRDLTAGSGLRFESRGGIDASSSGRRVQLAAVV